MSAQRQKNGIVSFAVRDLTSLGLDVQQRPITKQALS